ncbi:hypothetical protein V6N13_042081 [Hibiscus sabdariffa]|uniref:Uncharacterized protein n=1 Tax=Hibiscus sabdariffa TaxID=183260 RepID=A0ABR2DDY4_9ROSI
MVSPPLHGGGTVTLAHVERDRQESLSSHVSCIPLARVINPGSMMRDDLIRRMQFVKTTKLLVFWAFGSSSLIYLKRRRVPFGVGVWCGKAHAYTDTYPIAIIKIPIGTSTVSV